MSEQLVHTEVNQLVLPAHQSASRIALEGAGVATQHFYGAEDHTVDVTSMGEHRIAVKGAGEAAFKQEVVGVGYDAEAALKDSLKVMRSLETVRTRSLVRIEMTEKASVDFTSLEHYSPRVAPGSEAHPIPTYLERLITSDEAGDDTYRNTVAQEGWQIGVRLVVEAYLATPTGQDLLSNLKIRSLDHLTPEQAVKLSAAFVQDVSKYSYDDVKLAHGETRADNATSVQLLEEGMRMKDDPSWQGNGVCRNIASNVKAVFESLKATQGELSMLNNTYAVFSGGGDGEGYDDKRKDAYTLSFDRDGHAWNTFVTIDAEGSAAATIIDATWALGRDAATAMKHLDRTDARATAQLVTLFEQSERQLDAFYSLSHYMDGLTRRSVTDPTLNPEQRETRRKYIATEYLRLANKLQEVPEDYYLPQSLMATAYRMRAELDKREIATLFRLDTAGDERERLKAIVVSYDKDRKVGLPEWKRAKNLLFKDDQLQNLVFDAIGDQRLAQLIENSGDFRARLRQQRPEALPAFDPYVRQSDAAELSSLVADAGIRDRDPKMIIRAMHRTLKRLAGDEAVFDAITAGRSDYDLAVNFKVITASLRKRDGVKPS